MSTGALVQYVLPEAWTCSERRGTSNSARKRAANRTVSFRHGSRFGSGAIHGTVSQSMTRVVTVSRDDCNIAGRQGVLTMLLPTLIRCFSKCFSRALTRLCDFRRHDIGNVGFSELRETHSTRSFVQNVLHASATSFTLDGSRLFFRWD